LKARAGGSVHVDKWSGRLILAQRMKNATGQVEGTAPSPLVLAKWRSATESDTIISSLEEGQDEGTAQVKRRPSVRQPKK
jgi:hypothetical protein